MRDRARLALVVLCLVGSAAACRGRSPSHLRSRRLRFRSSRRACRLGSPVEVTYKFVVAAECAENQRELSRVRPFSRRRQRADVDRRSRLADSDDAMEAWAGHRIHEDDVRPGLSLSGPDDGVDGPLFACFGLAAAARRAEQRPARVHRWTTRAAPTNREHFRDVQGWLAPGRNAAGQCRRRVAVDEEGSHALGEKSEKRRDVVSSSRPARSFSRRRSR